MPVKKAKPAPKAEPVKVNKPDPEPPKSWDKWFKRLRPAPDDKEGWAKWERAVRKHMDSQS
jgi:hypothetical protein